MKRIVFTVSLLLFTCDSFYAQQYYQLYYNLELQEQVTLNHEVRIAYEKLYQKDYKKQKEWYRDAKEKLTHVIFVKNQIYESLTNVNQSLRQGKQITAVYKDFEKLLHNIEEMVDLSIKNPQYAPLITRVYSKLMLHATQAYDAIGDQVTRDDKDYLMDAYDRQYLLNKIHHEIRAINGWVLHINNYLRKAKQKPYLRHFKVINNWYVQDKAMITRIVTNYRYNIKNW